ncbi:triphosphoribosyl-dephospho-CoA synthase [Rubrobacter indicoceani]|uniref:triphosphoribosyl-dephospho-CoA synthase n=1 Tax=Rubrobacter indicoceani TaxID=2051957 RepID=UPI0013C4D1EB|nr:triphosphoribosyl-dephospho-CoA synthase [Rubrobacter indicoceani]
MNPARSEPVSARHASRAAYTALTLTYGAPTPGLGSRYADGGSDPSGAAYEAKMLGAGELRLALDAFSEAQEPRLGGVLREAVLASESLSGYADLRGAAYLTPLVGADIGGVSVGELLDRAGIDDVRDYAGVFGGEAGPKPEHRALVGALDVAIAGSRRVILRDVMRFAARSDPTARDYASAFELSRELTLPAMLAALSRGDSTRAAVVQAYLETLAETPDADVAARAGGREAEEVSRMARGVVKAGGVYSRRGMEGVGNLDGILREDTRLSPTATEPVVIAAAYLVCVEHGPGVLGRRIRSTAYRSR